MPCISHLNKKVKNKSKEDRAVFMISNGIDIKLNVGDQWEQIFADDKISYGFFLFILDLVLFWFSIFSIGFSCVFVLIPLIMY